VQTSDSLHCVNSSLNISFSIWITLSVLELLRVLASMGGALKLGDLALPLAQKLLDH
jgi:hypothetical protein